MANNINIPNKQSGEQFTADEFNLLLNGVNNAITEFNTNSVEKIEWIEGEDKPEIIADKVIGDLVEGMVHYVQYVTSGEETLAYVNTENIDITYYNPPLTDYDKFSLSPTYNDCPSFIDNKGRLLVMNKTSWVEGDNPSLYTRFLKDGTLDETYNDGDIEYFELEFQLDNGLYFGGTWSDPRGWALVNEDGTINSFIKPYETHTNFRRAIKLPNGNILAVSGIEGSYPDFNSLIYVMTQDGTLVNDITPLEVPREIERILMCDDGDILLQSCRVYRVDTIVKKLTPNLSEVLEITLDSDTFVGYLTVLGDYLYTADDSGESISKYSLITGDLQLTRTLANDLQSHGIHYTYINNGLAAHNNRLYLLGSVYNSEWRTASPILVLDNSLEPVFSMADYETKLGYSEVDDYYWDGLDVVFYEDKMVIISIDYVISDNPYITEQLVGVDYELNRLPTVGGSRTYLDFLKITEYERTKLNEIDYQITGSLDLTTATKVPDLPANITRSGDLEVGYDHFMIRTHNNNIIIPKNKVISFTEYFSLPTSSSHVNTIIYHEGYLYICGSKLVKLNISNDEVMIYDFAPSYYKKIRIINNKIYAIYGGNFNYSAGNFRILNLDGTLPSQPISEQASTFEVDGDHILIGHNTTIKRFSSEGVLDVTFNGTGILTIANGVVKIQKFPDNSGYLLTHTTLKMLKIDNAGQLDETFNTNISSLVISSVTTNSNEYDNNAINIIGDKIFIPRIGTVLNLDGTIFIQDNSILIKYASTSLTLTPDGLYYIGVNCDDNSVAASLINLDLTLHKSFSCIGYNRAWEALYYNDRLYLGLKSYTFLVLDKDGEKIYKDLGSPVGNKIKQLQSDIGGLKFVKLYESEYQALDLADEIDENTIYFRVPDPIVPE